jgi:hypothetical protein
MRLFSASWKKAGRQPVEWPLVIIDQRPLSRQAHGRDGVAYLAVAALLVLGLAWLAVNAQHASSAGREADIHRRWVVCQFVCQNVNPYPLALAALERAHGQLGAGAKKPHVYTIPRPTPAEQSGEDHCVPAAVAPVIAQHGLPEAVYPPSADLLLSWTIGLLPDEGVHLVWLLVNLALLVGLALLMCRRELAVPAQTLLALSAVMALLLLWSPTQETVHTGQFSILVSVCVLLAVRWLDEHEIAAGAALSLALIKPSLALPFLLLPLIRGRWRCLGVIVVSHLSATCLQAAVFGCTPWELMRQWAAVAAYFTQGQFTLQEVLAALHVEDTPAGAALVAAFALAVTGWCWTNRGAPDELLVDLLCFVSVLWTYHGLYDFVILFVPLARRMSAVALPGQRMVPLLALATFLCLSLALSPVVYSDEVHLASRLVRHAARLLLGLWFAALMLQVARAARRSSLSIGPISALPSAVSVARVPRRAPARLSPSRSRRAPSTVPPAPPA